MSDKIAEDLRERYEFYKDRLPYVSPSSAGKLLAENDREKMNYIERISRAEARIAELVAENKIYRSDISGLEAAVNGLIAEKAKLEAENKRLRECADAMAYAIERDSYASIAEEDSCQKYRAAFPREEAKPCAGCGSLVAEHTGRFRHCPGQKRCVYTTDEEAKHG